MIADEMEERVTTVGGRVCVWGGALQIRARKVQSSGSQIRPQSLTAMNFNTENGLQTAFRAAPGLLLSQHRWRALPMKCLDVSL